MPRNESDNIKVDSGGSNAVKLRILCCSRTARSQDYRPYLSSFSSFQASKSTMSINIFPFAPPPGRFPTPPFPRVEEQGFGLWAAGKKKAPSDWKTNEGISKSDEWKIVGFSEQGSSN